MKFSLSSTLFVLLILAHATSIAVGQTSTKWVSDENTDFALADNWDAGAPVGNLTSIQAFFDGTGTANPVLVTSQSVRGLTLGGGAYELSASEGATLTVGTGGIIASVGNHTISANVDLGMAQSVRAASGMQLTMSGAISGSASSALSIDHVGAVIFSGTNTYAGGTTLSHGTLTLTATGSINHSAKDLVVGDSASGGTASLTIAAGGTAISDNGRVGSGRSDTGSADISGTWTMSSALYVGASGGNGTLTVRDGGTVSSTAVYVGHGRVRRGTATSTLTIQDGGTVNVDAGSGTMTLADDANYTSTLNITGTTSAGILNAASVDGSVGTAILNFNHTASDHHFTTDGTASGTAVVITGSTAVNHTDAGTTTLSGTNTHTGATTVSAGKLIVSGSATTSAFTVNGGTLSGSGTVGNLTLANDGILAPGNSPGTLNASDTTWESGATYEWEINNAAGIVSTNWDLLNITGGLSINATDADPFTLNLISLTIDNAAGEVPNFDANADASWTFLQTTTGITFGDGASIGASFVLNTSGFQNTLNGSFGIAHVGNNLNVTYTALSAVPEPGSFALLAGLGMVGFIATRRRRSN